MMGSRLPPDPYNALGVGADADHATIRAARRSLVLRYYPDRIRDPVLQKEAKDIFITVQNAWEVLNDPLKKAKYDLDRLRLKLDSTTSRPYSSALQTNYARTNDVENPYELLGVKKGADISAIRIAHRKLVLKHHPDRIRDRTQVKSAWEVFEKIQQAYELLSDPVRKSEYDASAQDHTQSTKGTQGSYQPPRPKSILKTSRASYFEETSSGSDEVHVAAPRRRNSRPRPKLSKAAVDDLKNPSPILSRSQTMPPQRPGVGRPGL